MDEKNQILTVNCWLTQIWNDTHLTWNASDFGGITNIALPYDKVWKPDIILYNKLVAFALYSNPRPGVSSWGNGGPQNFSVYLKSVQN